MINKKAFFKSLIVILLLIVIIFTFIQIRNTLARYETATTTDGDVDVAFWLSDDPTNFASARLVIDDIYPSNVPYTYSFTVNNCNQNGRIVETDMEYDVTLTATTNLPLSYTVQRNGSTCATYDPLDTTPDNLNQLITDTDGTYYVKMDLGTNFVLDTIDDTTKQKRKVTDTFVISVTFPKSNSTNEYYADLMEDIKLELSARQVIEE